VDWWFKARRLNTVLPAVLAVFTLLLLLLRDSATALPSLVPAFSGSVPMALLLPVPVCAGVLVCLDSRLHEAEETSVRSPLPLDLALVTGTVAAVGLLAAVVESFAPSRAADEAARNTAFLLGLALVTRPWVGMRATLPPVAWVMAVAVAGYHLGHPLAWTVIARPPSDPPAALGAGVALLLGLGAQCLPDLGGRFRTKENV
jgi:hypothetical protein